MAVYYAVEFPFEDSKSSRPHTVSENKVKIEVVKHWFFGVLLMKKAMLWRNISRPQTLREVPRRNVESHSREKAEIRNKDGRSRKKPAKLDDYKDPSNTISQFNKSQVKKPRKALFKVQLNSKSPLEDLKNFRGNSVVDEEEDENDEDLDENIVLACCKRNVAGKKKSKHFSHPNGNDPSSKTKKVVKSVKVNRKKSEGCTRKSAVKKSREETADSQSCEISQNLALNMMKVIRHRCNSPVEFSINVPYCFNLWKTPSTIVSNDRNTPRKSIAYNQRRGMRQLLFNSAKRLIN